VGLCLGALVAVGSGVAVSAGDMAVKLGVALAVAAGVLVVGNGVAGGVDVSTVVIVDSGVMVGSAVEAGARVAGDGTALFAFSQLANARSASSNKTIDMLAVILGAMDECESALIAGRLGRGGFVMLFHVFDIFCLHVFSGHHLEIPRPLLIQHQRFAA
jgi:hypothetical protein